MFCPFHKFMISNALDADRPLWSVTQRHVDQCPQCSRFHALCRSMGRRLKADSHHLDGIVSKNLSDRILEDLTATEVRRTTISVRLQPLLTAACILVLAAISAVLLLKRPPAPPDDQYVRATAAVRDIYESGALLAGGLTRGNPLESEIRNLTVDTESAVRFVIANMAVTPPVARLPD